MKVTVGAEFEYWSAKTMGRTMCWACRMVIRDCHKVAILRSGGERVLVHEACGYEEEEALCGSRQ